MKKILIDLDNTLTINTPSNYQAKPINEAVLQQLLKYRQMGFQIAIFTSRNMNTYQGDLDKIRTYTLPIIIEWLSKYDVPYDEVIIGKPWCGTNGFYVDDRAIRPSEFIGLDYEQICNLLDKESKG